MPIHRLGAGRLPAAVRGGGGPPSCLDQHPSHGMKPASSHFLFAQLDALLVLAGLGVERGHE